MRILTVTIALLALVAAGCGGDDGGSLTVYSGREEELVAPLFERFQDETGITVEVRYGDSAELAATIAEEGDNSPADVFWAQDPGALGSVAAQLARLPEETLALVAERFRDDEGRWVGTSGRVRTIVYDTSKLSDDDVPSSVLDLVEPAWEDKVGIAPTNASFQAFVTAFRLAEGDQAARDWLVALKENGARTYEKNTPIVEAVAGGEIELGLVNHYYVGLVKAESPDAPVANHYLAPGDPGALVSVAGAGILASAANADEAQELVSFLLSEPAQAFYAEEAEEAEYPLVDGVEAAAGLTPLAELEGPDIDLGVFGVELERTVELLRETGWLT